MAYRTASHEATGVTPAKLTMGRQLRLPLDLLLGPAPKGQEPKVTKDEYLAKLQQGLQVAHSFARTRLNVTTDRMKTWYNLDATARMLEAGDVVWLYRPLRKKGLSPKLIKPWVGPYVIVKRINDLVYRIRLSPQSKPMVVHRNRLRLCVGTDDSQLQEVTKKKKLDTVDKSPQVLRRSKRIAEKKQH